MKELVFTETIKAPAKKVWETMLGPETYKVWVSAAWPNSHYEGEWKEGNAIRFIGADGSGTLATILKHEVYQHTLAKHIAMLGPGGVEDRDSEVAKTWVGSTENYTFTENNGNTAVKVVMQCHPEWAPMLAADWPKALVALKKMCEQ